MYHATIYNTWRAEFWFVHYICISCKWCILLKFLDGIKVDLRSHTWITTIHVGPGIRVMLAAMQGWLRRPFSFTFIDILISPVAGCWQAGPGLQTHYQILSWQIFGNCSSLSPSKASVSSKVIPKAFRVVNLFTDTFNWISSHMQTELFIRCAHLQLDEVWNNGSNRTEDKVQECGTRQVLALEI